MACLQVQKNDVGTAFDLTVVDDGVALDISGATQLLVLFQNPNGDLIQKTGVFVTNGSDGQIRYISQSGFLDTVGRWSLQAAVTTPSGSWRSEVGTFKVERNLV